MRANHVRLDIRYAFMERIMVICLRLIFGITFAIAAGLAEAQMSPGVRFETFLSNVSADSDGALEALFAESKIAETKPQAWAAMKAQTKRALAAYGKPLGFEKINERDFSPSLKRFTYLQKFELYPVVWHAFFYRAKDEWVASSVVVSDNVGPMLLGL
jgi:hypothetical protein